VQSLNCPGFGATYEIDGKSRSGCDTWFAVDRSYVRSWTKITESGPLIETLHREFETIGYLPDVVITGGEPLLYHADAPFYETVSWLVKQGIRVTFETNGTVAVDFERYPIYRRCSFALSVKLSNSGEPESRRIVPGALERLALYAEDVFLKFTLDRVLVETTAATEIGSVRQYVPNVPVYCMPVGHSRNAIAENDRFVFDFCKQHNYYYSDRLHIRVFDQTVGV